MRYTTPDNIPAPEPGDDVDPLEDWFGDQADAVQAALVARAAATAGAAGKVNYTASIAAGAYGTDTKVTFPAGRFTAPPAVVATAGHSRITAAVSAITKDGFTLNSANWTTGTAPGSTSAPIVFNWIARVVDA